MDLGLATLVFAAAVPATVQPLADLMAEATPLGNVPAFANDYVSVHYTLLAYPEADRRTAEARPVVLYVRVAPRPGIVNAGLLEPPRGARPSWRPGVVARAVQIEVLAPPPAPPALGQPGTDLPRGVTEESAWDGGRLVRATFRPLDYGVGAGRYASVTTFLSDGVVEVSNRGLRHRMGVQAGDAFWFEPATRITVLDDNPVGAAIVQLLPGQERRK